METRSAGSGITYRDSGVDIDAAAKAMARARDAIRRSHGARVLADVGSFGGLFDARGLGRNPVLVATTDGVGTKVRLAAAAERFDTVGRDLVHHCINDALVQGAEPLV
ncbi:MAG: AIR synthase related protein, partial [Planctomycetota bacterium]